jgi:hypothetical protein
VRSVDEVSNPSELGPAALFDQPWEVSASILAAS